VLIEKQTRQSKGELTAPREIVQAKGNGSIRQKETDSPKKKRHNPTKTHIQK
jgi:hypothetical protein